MTQLIPDGQVIKNRYRILELLGEGASGQVYRVADVLHGGILLALKVMDSRAADPGIHRNVVDAFEQEARMLSAVSHPNLPCLHEYFVSGAAGEEMLFLVMDYYQGEDLATCVSRHPRFVPQHLVKKWALQLCDAIYYLHSMKTPVIFRDLKPENVIRTKDGNVRLIDFGIAKMFKPGQGTAEFIKGKGTPGYSPPEQYGKGGTDERSDVYALGATLYFLATGNVPPESIARYAGDTLIPPKAVNEAISDQLNRTIIKAMALVPGNRFSSARGMRNSLETIVLGIGLVGDEEAMKQDLHRARFCRNCGERHIRVARFCHSCGADLEAKSKK